MVLAVTLMVGRNEERAAWSMSRCLDFLQSILPTACLLSARLDLSLETVLPKDVGYLNRQTSRHVPRSFVPVTDRRSPPL